MTETPAPEFIEVNLLTMVQKLKRYEVAGYNCASTYARILGLDDEAKILRSIISEGEMTEEKLTQLAGRSADRALRQASSEPVPTASDVNCGEETVDAVPWDRLYF